jgi:hypothetical protein
MAFDLPMTVHPPLQPMETRDHLADEVSQMPSIGLRNGNVTSDYTQHIGQRLASYLQQGRLIHRITRNRDQLTIVFT